MDGLQDPVKSPLASAVANLLSLIILTSTSLITFAYLRVLQPLYGTAPIEHHLNKIVWVACIIGSFAPTVPVWPAVFVWGVLTCTMPLSTYWVAVLTGRTGDIIWGPVSTHSAIIGPLIYLATALVKALQEAPDQNGVTAASQVISLPVCRMAIMTLQEIWPLIPFFDTMEENVVFSYLGGFAVTIWLLSPFLVSDKPSVVNNKPSKPDPSTPSKTKKKTKGVSPAKSGTRTSTPVASTTSQKKKSAWRVMMLPSIPLLMNFTRPPTLVKPFSGPWAHPTAPLRVLSAVHSSHSGVVLVGDILPPRSAAEEANLTHPHSLRYLRAGHSLLGGVWIEGRAVARDRSGPVGVDESGSPLGDSIYSTFVLQEAAKLVVRSDGSSPQTALTIGLGTGVSTSAFIRQGIATTIVELDPAVYAAAQRYFGLATPDPTKVFLQDGSRWVRRRKAEITAPESTNEELFDIVVHDCFSGGGVPGYMFTLQFWEDLKNIMSPNGVVAVNYAGKLGSDSSRAIVLTLQKAFGECRAFHDSMETLSDEQLDNEFVNWVFFCSSSSGPIKFHPPTESDFLNSYLRERVLTTLPEREIEISRIVGDVKENEREKYVLTDMNNPLVGWQKKDALHHWKVMREVLPDVFWETY